MVEIDKEIMEIYKDLCQANDQIIKKEKNSFMPICALIGPNKTVTIMGMIFKNGDQKEAMKQVILKHIAKQDVKAYILIMDAKMTVMDMKTGKREVKDVSMRTIYTPKGHYIETIIYKDGEILEKMDTKDMTFQSEWDLWGEHVDYDEPETQKAMEEYKQYKKDHKDLYGNLA